MPDIRTTPQIDDFSGPNEDPLSVDGKWDHLPVYPLALRRLSNSATSQSHPTALSNYISFSYYTQITVDGSGDWEVWGCTDGGQLGAALETWRIAVWEGSPDSGSGYLAYYGGGLSKDFVIRNYSGGWLNNLSFSDVAAGTGGYPDMMLLRRSGGDIELWASYDDGANWNLTCTTSAGAHVGTLYMSLGVEDPTNGGLSWGCFGGGEKNRTQIYRIIRTDRSVLDVV